MQVIKTQYGIELIPENEFEKDCIKHIASKSLEAKFEDQWNQCGNLKLEFKPHARDN